jgi:hypothetical protein
MKQLVLSEQGKNWKGQDLTEENLNANIRVSYNNKLNYRTGNRYHDMVELYSGGILVKTVKISEVCLYKYVKK